MQSEAKNWWDLFLSRTPYLKRVLALDSSKFDLDGDENENSRNTHIEVDLFSEHSGRSGGLVVLNLSKT